MTYEEYYAAVREALVSGPDPLSGDDADAACYLSRRYIRIMHANEVPAADAATIVRMLWLSAGNAADLAATALRLHAGGGPTATPWFTPTTSERI